MGRIFSSEWPYALVCEQAETRAAKYTRETPKKSTEELTAKPEVESAEKTATAPPTQSAKETSGELTQEFLTKPGVETAGETAREGAASPAAGSGR